MSKTTPDPKSDLGLKPFESQPHRRYASVDFGDWLDEMQPYVDRYPELLSQGKAAPRRTPWEGTFEL